MYGDRALQIGDQVYARRVGGWQRQDIQKGYTIVRTTHNGARLVVDNGAVILARNNDQVGNDNIRWHLYTPDVQAEWDAANRRRAVEMKLSAWGILMHRPHWRALSTDAVERIAAAIEGELDIL